MFTLRHLLEYRLGCYEYIWIDVLLIKETKKAVLIMFDDQKAWLPKTWIAKTKYRKNSHIITIKISLYHWTKKFR